MGEILGVLQLSVRTAGQVPLRLANSPRLHNVQEIINGRNRRLRSRIDSSEFPLQIKNAATLPQNLY